MLRHNSKPSDTVIQQGKAAAGLVRDIADATNVSYLRTIAGISLLIIEAAQVRVAATRILRGNLLMSEGRLSNPIGWSVYVWWSVFMSFFAPSSIYAGMQKRSFNLHSSEAWLSYWSKS